MLELLEYQFFQNALLATLLISICCGIIGTYIVARRMVFISGGVTHASFGGLGMAYYLGLPPMLGAAIFAVSSSLLIDKVASDGKIREDSLIGMLWSAGMALGVLFIYLTPGYAPDLMSYLFGNILTVTTDQIWYATLLAVAIILFFTFYCRPLFYVAFDRNYSKTRDLPVNLLNRIVLILVALTIVISMKLAGIILVISYLTIPQMIAGMIHKTFNKQLWISTLISVVGSIIGLFVAAAANLPSGATIVLCFLSLLLIARLVKMVKRKK